MTKRLLFIAAGFFLIGLAILISCSHEITPPEPVDPEEHLFYIGAAKGGLVKVFSVEQKKFIDSVVCNGIPDSIVTTLNVIGDDSLLAISYIGGTYLINLKTKEVVDSLNYSNMIVSPNSEYFIAGNISMGDKRELHKFDGLEYITDIPGLFEQFDNKSKCITYSLFYGADSTTVSVYDIETDSTITKQKYSLGVGIWFWYSFPVKKLNKIFFGGDAYPYRYFAGVTDFYSDTARVLRYFPLVEYGDASLSLPIISPDEKYLYFSAIIGTFWGGVPDETIYVHNVESEDSIATIALPGGFVPSAYTMSYDGKYLTTKAFSQSTSDVKTEFCLVDAVNFTVIGTYSFGGPLSKMATKCNTNIGI
jgi:hypothetical protein